MNSAINNIRELIEENNTFTVNDKKELEYSITDIFTNYILENILNMNSPYFEENLNKYITEIHTTQLTPCYNNFNNYRINIRLKSFIKAVKKELYKKIIPPRSYKKSFIRNIKFDINILSKKVVYLQNLPQPEQRTEEWYVYRHNLLTASSLWKVFGTQSSQNQLIYEKCSPFVMYKNAPINSPLHWGQKYEPVSTEFYKKLFNTEISDFGCIKHPKYPFIGASPDGINTYISNARYGRMLEIKNIVNRVINGIPKMEYWIQMQLQMETCDLNECDFLETKFIEYNNEEEFLADGTFTHSSDGKSKGIMILFSYNGKLHYEYAPLYISRNEYIIWEENILHKNLEGEWIQNIYWKLENYSNVLVLRNKLWFDAALPKIEVLWNTIEKERISGYEHRAPKKRKTPGSELIVQKCYITMDIDNQ